MRHAVVLLSGLWMPALAMRAIANACGKSGFSVHHFYYSATREGNQQIVERLRDFIRDLPYETIHCVGHSYGGLLVLKALEAGDLRVQRAVCLGSPILGSGSAAGLASYAWGRFLLGRSLPLLRQPALADFSSKVEVGVLAGSFGAGLGRFFTHHAGPHDGAVAVRETQVPWAKDSIVVPVAHSQMLFSKQVVQLTVRFLQDGRFQ